MKTVSSGSLMLIFAPCQREATRITIMYLQVVARDCSIFHGTTHTKRNRQSQAVIEFQIMAHEWKQERLTI
jgi:hypothetical protein